jgi:hypothetical protein
LSQRIARHADVDVTSCTYAHADIEAMREALDSIEWAEVCAVVTTPLLQLSQLPILSRPFYLVGVAGFEPTAPRSQSECATKLRHTPVH